MTKELVTAGATVAEIANDPQSLPLLQGQLKQWCEEKLVEVRGEYDNLESARAQAKASKWNTAKLTTAVNKALERVEFYEKVLDALNAGYMLFPPIDWCDVIAVRLDSGYHNEGERHQRYGLPSVEIGSRENAISSGTGEYYNPTVKWQRWGKVTSKEADGTTEEIQNWRPIETLGKPEFPLVMARAQCVDAANAAMEQKFFDDIALYPPRANKDPVILGRIYDKKRGRHLNFLISWRVDKRDL